MAKRTNTSYKSDKNQIRAKKIKHNSYIKYIILRNDHEPHVELESNDKFVKIGKYIYQNKGNKYGSDYIGINQTQYEDLKSYIIKNEVMINPIELDHRFPLITQAQLKMTNLRNKKIFIFKDELINILSNYFGNTILSVGQSFHIEHSLIDLNIDVDDLKFTKTDNESKKRIRTGTMMGSLSKNVEYILKNFSETSLIIYDKYVTLNDSNVYVKINNCSKINNYDDNKKLPLIFDKQTIKKYIYPIIKNGMVNDQTFRFDSDNYRISFSVKIIDDDSTGRNIYKIIGSDSLNIRSMTKNIIIIDNICSAKKIYFKLDPVDEFTSPDNIIVMENMENFLRQKLNHVIVGQVIDYYHNGKLINMKVNNAEPIKQGMIQYLLSHDDKNRTDIVFVPRNDSKLIIVDNNIVKNARKIILKVKKQVNQVLLINLLSISLSQTNDKPININNEELVKYIREVLPSEFTCKQKFKFIHNELNFYFTIKKIITDSDISGIRHGFLATCMPDTVFEFIVSKKEESLIINNNTNSNSELLNNPIDELEKYVGGITDQLKTVVKTLCLSRGKLKQEFMSRGLKAIRGIVFHGPPGTGKTSLARQLGKILGCTGDRFRLISGPEIFNKWVGQSEQNVRNIFKPAKDAWKKNGINAPLFMTVIDEIDAILPRRTESEGNPVRNSVINQFLAELDGLVEFNNMICIGLTNKLELLDPAILRPGRLGVHIKIDNPNYSGRLKIFEIHTKKLRELNRLDNIDFDKLALLTDNFSGADIEGIIQTASLTSLERLNKISDIDDQVIDKFGKITMDDFINAITEVKIIRQKNNAPPPNLYI